MTVEKRIELRAFESVITKFNEKMLAKVESLAAAHRESAEIGIDMLSLAGAIKGIAFARRTLLELLDEATGGLAEEIAGAQPKQRELPTKEG